jgi:diguanylate cyclase (GGDEF)-like protein/PAS domain S-box-containing protein
MSERSELADSPTPSCRLVRNEAALITDVDESVIDVLGWRPEQLIGSPSTTLIHPSDQASAVSAWFAMLDVPGSTRTWRGRYRTGDGEWRWIEAVNTNRLDDPENPVVLTTMRLASTEQMTLEDELRAREELIARLTDALPVGVFQVDRDQRILFTNGRLHHILGIPPAGDVSGQFASLTDQDLVKLVAAIQVALTGREVNALEFRYNVEVPHPDFPSTRVCEVALRPLTNGADRVTGAIGCLSDVTDSVQLRRELEHRATTDGLTGCLNRTATFERLDQAMRESMSSDGGMAVIFVDLDDFKNVNDTYGHATGDRALLTVAERIRGAVGATEVVGRIGGDEFLIVCTSVGSPEEVVSLAARVAASIRGTLLTDSGTVQLVASVGTAWTNGTVTSPDILISRADEAMYQSKFDRNRSFAVSPTDRIHTDL